MAIMNTDTWDKVKMVWSLEAESIDSLAYNIEEKALLSVVEAIEHCIKNKNRILTTGSGTSAAAAKKIAHTFSCIEVPSCFISPADALHGGLGALQKGDILIAISKGGETEEILKMIPNAKVKGGKIIGVTESNISKLAQISDIPLIIKTKKEADPFNMLATASTLSVIAVFDAISIVLMERNNFSKKQFAIIHPSGAVGKRLTCAESEVL